MAGSSSEATSFMTQVSIKSMPVDLEFLSPAMILLTSSGETDLKLKVQRLCCITSLSLARGSVTA